MHRYFFFLLPVILLWATPLSAQIILSQDFDSGSLDVAASTVNGSSVDLVGRNTWTPFDRYRWVYFSAENVQGITPQFSISSDDYLGSYENHRYVYSYDRETWEFFENASINSGEYEFSNMRRSRRTKSTWPTGCRIRFPEPTIWCSR